MVVKKQTKSKKTVPLAEPITLARRLSRSVENMPFSPPVEYIYNPIRHARSVHEFYLESFGSGRKKVVFLGMNPGPFGMAQTGIPFGQVSMVRDWMKVPLEVAAKIKKPKHQHPKRPIEGFECTRMEVSGSRLWGLFAERFKTAQRFFKDHIVANYCPLVFMADSGANITPDKIKKTEVAPLNEACDRHLEGLLRYWQPEFVVGVGKFALKRAELVCTSAGLGDIQLVSMLHPSPANPAANKDWAGQAQKQLVAAGVWAKH